MTCVRACAAARGALRQCYPELEPAAGRSRGAARPVAHAAEPFGVEMGLQVMRLPSFLRPVLERGPERFMQRFLGKIEIAEEADQRGQHAARFRAVNRVYRARNIRAVSLIHRVIVSTVRLRKHDAHAPRCILESRLGARALFTALCAISNWPEMCGAAIVAIPRSTIPLLPSVRRTV